LSRKVNDILKKEFSYSNQVELTKLLSVIYQNQIDLFGNPIQFQKFEGGKYLLQMSPDTLSKKLTKEIQFTTPTSSFLYSIEFFPIFTN
jgi:hypothetical protein